MDKGYQLDGVLAESKENMKSGSKLSVPPKSPLTNLKTRTLASPQISFLAIHVCSYLSYFLFPLLLKIRYVACLNII